MERELKSQRGGRGGAELDFPLRWGSRKRLRCVKVRDDVAAAAGGRRRATSRVNRRVIRGDDDDDVEDNFPSPTLRPSPRRLHNTLRRAESVVSESRRSTVSSVWAVGREEEEKGVGGAAEEKVVGGGGGVVLLPRFFLSLSNKEKEEDFMLMKGCKLPQRPKKRAKLIQKAVVLVSPGAWLSDLSQERYEVREKKSSRKRRRGLKAMCLESDSE